MVGTNLKSVVLAAAVVAAVAGVANAAAFTSGDLVVYRVGTGSAALSSSATAVFVDEYTPAGALVQSIAMPTAVSGANHALTSSGSATSEGLLQLSADGHYVTVTGYDAAPGTASVKGTASNTVARVVGVIDASGAVDTTTAIGNAFSGDNFRGAVTTNGTDLWLSGTGGSSTGGVYYATVGSTSATKLSTTSTNLRGVDIFAGQIYVSSSSGSIRVATVGTGLPTTSGQTITNLAGFPTTGSPYEFFLADLSPAVDGVDTAYVVDDAAGLQKYSLVGGSWTSNGSVSATGLTGLTGSVAVDGSVTLYGASTSAIYSLSDASGYNAAIGGSLNSIVSAGANTAFRGIDFAPTAVPEPATVGVVAVAAVALAGRRPRK